jgi:hypothetical protein
MLHPQLLIYEADGSLARLLRPLAEARKWAVREPRLPASCYALLESSCPSVLVLRLGLRPTADLDLLEQVHWLYPDTGRVAVTDVPVLAGLAWHLGASHVQAAAEARDQLPAVVVGLMQAALAGRNWTRGGRAPAADSVPH